MRAIVTLFFALATVTLCGVVSAQQPTQQSEVAVYAPPSGDYKPLTVWDKVKLGTAYYTDPQFVQNAHIAYSFDGDDFISKGKEDQLYDLAKNGHIAFGTPIKGKGWIRVEPTETMLDANGIRNSSDLTRTLRSQHWTVLSTQPQLLGEAANSAVVKSTNSNPPK